MSEPPGALDETRHGWAVALLRQVFWDDFALAQLARSGEARSADDRFTDSRSAVREVPGPEL